MFDINLYTNNSEDNKLDKSLSLITTLSGSMKQSSSILSPIFTIEYSGTLKNCNYMYIPEFGRYYFITDITILRDGIYQISARVDVLTTYKTQIRGNRAIIAKSQNTWNTYLDDGTFKVYSTPYLTQKSFPSGFSGNSFVLAVSGK